MLIDIGLSCREVTRRLNSVGVEPGDITAIMITHAHGDHTCGARTFSKRHGVPVYTTKTIKNEWGVNDLSKWHMLTANNFQQVCGLNFQPFAIPHDASETIAFRIETPDGPIGFATDVGAITTEMVERFRDCCVLVIESNHATELLRVSPYAISTRKRIASSRGHLSNESLAEFIRTKMGPTVRCIVLAHLSRVNNVPEIAELTCREALIECGREDVQVIVAHQDKVAQTINLAALFPVQQSRTTLVQESLLF